MNRRRTIALLAVGLAATLSLAACSVFPPPGAVFSNRGDHSAAPMPIAAIGQCWNDTLAHFNGWADWKGDAPTDCSSAHTSLTYAVGELSGTQPSDWAVSDSNPGLRPSVATAALQACDDAGFLPDATWNEMLLRHFFFMPSHSQWKAGARWVRCDIAVTAWGTTRAAQKLADLPATLDALSSSVSKDPKRYAFCMNNTKPWSSAGPLDDPAGVLADCRNTPEWSLRSRLFLPGGAGAKFPGSAAVRAKADKTCSAAKNGPDETWDSYFPSATTWAKGDREIHCWIANRTAQTS